MDFTLKTYRFLLLSLKEKSYSILPFKETIIDYGKASTQNTFRRNPIEQDSRLAILRHDVDCKPVNALHMGRAQSGNRCHRHSGIIINLYILLHVNMI